MYVVTIEIHATPSNYWSNMEFIDKAGKLHEKSIQGGKKATANSNALQAAIDAVKILNGICLLDIHTDNDYLIGAIHNGWLASWQKNGWKNAKGTNVKNLEQWQVLSGLLARHSVRFIKI
ncbi:RNase H [Lacrimispora sphenoides]|uniref:RNase H family protein n=1 Tax=Lacrimispora sphenoides TaxID=29370 RepID=UPI0008C4EDED|nr:RNase H family protein [Lacrimispora sphenoides]SEU24164.1 RNase H [Lacrimispora sphenoides]